MQIILLEKIVNLGGLGDVVKVKDGFARNYLIPHGKAKRATPMRRPRTACTLREMHYDPLPTTHYPPSTIHYPRRYQCRSV